MNEWEFFAYKVRTIGINTTRTDIVFPSPAEQYEHVIESVALEDETTTYDHARLFTTNGVEEYQHREWTSPSAGILYYDNTLKLPVLPGERFGLAFFDITANDVLHAYVRGRRRKAE